MSIPQPLQQPQTFTDRVRIRFQGILDAVGRTLNRWGIHPNAMTVAGVLGNAAAAMLLAQGKIATGGWIVLAMGAFDALDGTMARLRGAPTAWGAFLDSVADRYSELLLLGGLAYYYSVQQNHRGMILAYAAAAGSVLVSYTRARAEALGWEVKIGLLTRLERYLVLAPSLVFRVPLIGLSILAVGANITALQRIAFAHRLAKRTSSNEIREV